MRTFEDEGGRQWDAAVAEESYGTQRLIFAVRGGSELRAHVLDVSGRHEAEKQLLQLSERELRALLAAAPPWGPG